MTDTETTNQSRFKIAFRALKYRNFRLFYFGQGVSLVGTWMQQIAMSWLVYRITDSAFLLGMVGFLSNAPSLLLSPFAGVLADRWSRHRLMIAIQTLYMVQALVLAGLVMTDRITVAWIIILAIVAGLANAFDMPVRQAFMLDMIENRDDLSNAIALNSSIVNASRLIGPSVAGILIALVGEGVCFLANGLSYIAVIAALFAMRISAQTTRAQEGSMLGHLKEGFQYAWEVKPIRDILLLLSLVSLVAMPYTVLMPIISRDVLNAGPHGMGFLMGASGVGALAGAGFLLVRKSPRGLVGVLPIAAGLFGAGLVAFSFSRMFALSMVIMAVSGMGMISTLATGNTVLQTIADEDKRGRVMGLYAIAFRGMLPLGSLMAGSFAAKIGAPYTLMIGGLACVLGALLFARELPGIRAVMRPIYIQRGIIPASKDKPAPPIIPPNGQ